MTEKIRKGMMIRISDNIDATIRQWGNAKQKELMKGKIYKVIYSDRTSIDIRDDSKAYAFEKCDVKPIESTPPIPPVLFDPKNL
jgi:hypothetical protein